MESHYEFRRFARTAAVVFPLWRVNQEWIYLRVFLEARFSAVTSQTSQRLPATSQIVQIYQAHREVKQQLSLGNSGS